MPKSLPLPAHLQPLCDALVAACHADAEPPADALRTLCAWFDTEGWDPWMLDAGDQPLALPLSALAEACTDRDAREWSDLTPDTPLTDAARIAWGRQLLEDWEDDMTHPNVHTCQLVASSGALAVLGCEVAIEGQGGPSCRWRGLFTSRQAFLAQLATEGYWVGFLEDLPDNVILVAFSRPPQRSRRRNSAP